MGFNFDSLIIIGLILLKLYFWAFQMKSILIFLIEISYQKIEKIDWFTNIVIYIIHWDYNIILYFLNINTKQ